MQQQKPPPPRSWGKKLPLLPLNRLEGVRPPDGIESGDSDLQLHDICEPLRIQPHFPNKSPCYSSECILITAVSNLYQLLSVLTKSADSAPVQGNVRVLRVIALASYFILIMY